MMPESYYKFEDVDAEDTPINSLTYKLVNPNWGGIPERDDKQQRRIVGKINDKVAMEQAIKKRLFTNRWQYDIYSSDYGIDLDQYVGKDFDYLETDLPNEVRRCLLNDDRVNSVENFQFYKVETDKMLVKFTVNTIYGNIPIQGVI